MLIANKQIPATQPGRVFVFSTAEEKRMLISRKHVYVKGERSDGTPGTVDILDLDDESFRRFIVSQIPLRDVLWSDPKAQPEPFRARANTD